MYVSVGGGCWILSGKASLGTNKHCALVSGEQPGSKEDFKKPRSSPLYLSSYYITGNSTTNECRKMRY